MSVVAIGLANSTVSMYEKNTPVIKSTVIPEKLLGLDPDGQVDILIASEIQGLLNEESELLVHVMCQFEGTCPPGEVDTSTIQIQIKSVPHSLTPVPPPQPPFDFGRDLQSECYTGFASGFPPYVASVVGIVSPEFADSDLRCIITRIGGNANVTFNCTQIWIKYKVLN